MTTFSPISPSQFDVLGDEPIRWFRDWPDASVPMFAAGVYTIWDGELGFVYVGMSGRSIRPGDAAMDRRHGLVTRLHSHAQGGEAATNFVSMWQIVSSFLHCRAKTSTALLLVATPWMRTCADLFTPVWDIATSCVATALKPAQSRADFDEANGVTDSHC